MAPDLSSLRREYDKGDLRRSQLDPSPFRQFERWFDEGRETVIEPTAMALATSNKDSVPSLRMVLLKGYDERGFCFATNYESRKGRELSDNPEAALLFFWPALERQIRIGGRVEKLAESESDAIFMARPRLSRIAAISSRQSEPVDDRSGLEDQLRRVDEENLETEVVRPEFWGGYRVVPVEFEFWQGRRNRLHDRFQYLWRGTEWSIRRLQP